MKTKGFLGMIVAAFFTTFASDSANTPPTNNLVAYFPLNGNAVEAAGRTETGIVFGASPTTDRFGNTNGAFHFNGATDYIDRKPGGL